MARMRAIREFGRSGPIKARRIAANIAKPRVIADGLAARCNLSLVPDRQDKFKVLYWQWPSLTVALLCIDLAPLLPCVWAFFLGDAPTCAS
jgi:hypothetical protein